MNLLNVTKEERILLSKAKAKLLEIEPMLKNISDGKMIQYLLEKFVVGGKYGRK